MPFALRLIPAAAAACLLASCGGGGGSAPQPPGPPSAATGGVAVDGYLVGATVLCDSNGNGVSDPGELSVGTNAEGRFSFAAGCTSSLVLLGGTSADTGLAYKGRMMAPAGATVVSPLTTLMMAGMSAEQMQAALDLPADLNVLTTDPAQMSGDAYVHADLMRKTLAVQQLLQKLTELFAGLGGVNAESALVAIYAEVAAALAAEMAATPVLMSDGSLDEAALARLVEAAHARVQGADSVASGVRTALAAINADALSTVVTGGLKAQAEALMAASDAELVAETVDQQTDLRITTFVLENRSALADAPDADTEALGDDLTDEIKGIEPPPPPTNYLAVASDTLTLINGSARQAISLSQFQTGTGFPLSWPVSPTALMNVTLQEVGQYVIPTGQKLSAAVSLTEVSGGGQGELHGYIDNVTVEKTASGLRFSVPSTAGALVYGVSSDGKKRAVIDFRSSVAGVAHTLGMGSTGNNLVFGEVLDYAVNKVGADFSGIASLRGTYRLSIVLNGVPVRQADGTALPVVTVTVPTGLDANGAVTTSKSVAGPGITGFVTLTD